MGHGLPLEQSLVASSISADPSSPKIQEKSLTYVWRGGGGPDMAEF